MTDLTSIAGAVIALISAIISTFLIPYIKAHTDSARFDRIKAWVKTAVEAAEMIYTTSGMGEKKKAYVIAYLESRGFTVDSDTLNTLIESAVLELKKN